ncbi:MAG: hypothetical protein Alis3KO_00700 [Aliiglaciecola sp.]
MDRDLALGIAKVNAIIAEERHDYLPDTADEANTFEPHEWVLMAIAQAYNRGKQDGMRLERE